jgi:hypothetical protein
MTAVAREIEVTLASSTGSAAPSVDEGTNEEKAAGVTSATGLMLVVGPTVVWCAE